MKLSPRLLVIDDNPAIHQDYRKVLAPQTQASAEFMELESIVLGEHSSIASLKNIAFDLDSAMTGHDGLGLALRALEAKRPYSVAFVDMRMDPGWNGIETIKQLWKVQPTLQIVLCSAYSDYSWKEIVAELGANDSLVILRKPFDNIEVLQLALSLSRKWQMMQELRDHVRDLDGIVSVRNHDLAQANEDLRRQIGERSAADERFRAAFETASLPMCIVNLRAMEWVDCNSAFADISGWERSELISQNVDVGAFWSQQPPSLGALLASKFNVIGTECRFRNRRGEERIVLLSRTLLHLQNQAHVLLLLNDITDQRTVEEHSRQGMKLEAIGRLAAGVAHDFNNILTVIKGHASLLLGDESLPNHAQRAVEQMADASKRAIGLVRQLLAFGRQQVIAPKAVDVGTHIDLQAQMLRRLIGARMQLHAECQPHIPAAFVDPASLDQILINLVVNARDAMPNGGSVVIGCCTARVDEEHAASILDARSGDYILIKVSDTGTGIPLDVQAHIFEPFFSTKDESRGTGLGLATVHGLVKQQGGWIELESAPGTGTTFSIYLPQTHKPAEFPDPPTGALAPADWKIGGGRAALIVEDDESIRTMLRQLLARFGFDILDASSGLQAWEIWQQRRSDIQLVITDVIMPGEMSGLDLGKRINDDKPRVKIIYCTGYSEEMMNEKRTMIEGENFLAKPYDAQSMMHILNRLFPKAGGKAATSRSSRPMTKKLIKSLLNEPVLVD